MSQEWLYFLAGIGVTVVAGIVLAGGMYLVIQIAAWRGMN